ncbi:hypothetical protein AX769_09240 [Frondihabitans sp. PAMC 28766]|nr:hypothetical protein AX769_09240 [Frondihabitans sp. PAMC 28766]
MHSGDQIRLILGHDAADLVGVWDSDSERRDSISDDLGVPASVRYDSLDDLVATAKPEIVVVCSTTGDHVALVERLAPMGLHIILEKPFALNIAEADRMIEAARAAGTILAVNWPLAWYPAHLTTKRLIAEGTIGAVTEVHYYDGNRGPLTHVHDKEDRVDPDLEAKQASWWYSPEFGGGSLLDYLGYGATIATWFRDGELPTMVTAHTWGSDGLDVDEQSVVTASYASGLSTFQTKWGTFSNPWQHQPAPACGFVVVGTGGTITSRDFAPSVAVQTTKHPGAVLIPVDVPRPEQTSAVSHVIHALSTGDVPTGPTSDETSRRGQLIVDAAATAAATGRLTELASSVTIGH